MCRFVAYIGTPILADDLLYKPKHSIIAAQSMNAGEMSIAVNGDGFGIGWYAPELDNEPCIFRSIKPAWADQNLKKLAKKVYSPLIFAHVRAASPGSIIEEYNSHPFECGKLMFMHNGMIGGIKDIRRGLLRTLNDTAYDAILGSTDSEHFFGLILNHIQDPYGDVTCDEMVYAMEQALKDFSDLLLQHNIKSHSYLNFCLTNGTSIVAIRYTTNQHVQPATLYYMFGKEYRCDGDTCYMVQSNSTPNCIVLASEPFTARRPDWMKAERNSMLIIDETMRLRFKDIRLEVEEYMVEMV